MDRTPGAAGLSPPGSPEHPRRLSSFPQLNLIIHKGEKYRLTFLGFPHVPDFLCHPERSRQLSAFSYQPLARLVCGES
jgi:hypothetical protein